MSMMIKAIDAECREGMSQVESISIARAQQALIDTNRKPTRSATVHSASFAPAASSNQATEQPVFAAARA